ncbi:MAG TPA: hypothetical protein VI756_23680 [Blastocatellia bacterium]
MSDRVSVELQAKSEFWADAFGVEWRGQFPERELLTTEPGHFLVEREWLADVELVARKCFCTVVVAPISPDRRAWLKSFSPAKPK